MFLVSKTSFIFCHTCNLIFQGEFHFIFITGSWLCRIWCDVK